MKLETEPITDDEWLLRRVNIQAFGTDTAPLSPNAFRPVTKGNFPDTTGISLFREACLGSPADILRLMKPEKQADTGIVRIPVAQIKQMSFSIVSEPDQDIPGHVVIPELKASEYESHKADCLAKMQQLAAIANENILRRPPNQKNWRI